jgi:poly(3-hydroxybutyrate) depolymerase
VFNLAVSRGGSRRAAVLIAAFLVASAGIAQQPPAPAQPAPGGPPPGGAPRGPATIQPDARTQQRTYAFDRGNPKMAYVVYVSSKVTRDRKAPLVIALHGLGGDANFLVRDRLVDLAEEGGYIVAGPMGYNVSGWYGSPPIAMGGAGISPPNLAELSEKDVMNVLAMMRREFNVDPDRTYLMGHSMGGAGSLFLGQKHATQWAGVAAIAPAAFMMEGERAQILGTMQKSGVPLMIVQGDKDPVVPAENTRRWAATLKELGMKGQYIELPGGDHGNVIGNGMPEIFRFFAENVRKPAR